MNAQSPGYSKGYRDAKEEARHDLAAILRTYMLDTGADEPLTLKRAREIFMGTFGVTAADAEFGPEPDGGLMDRLAREVEDE